MVNPSVDERSVMAPGTRRATYRPSDSRRVIAALMSMWNRDMCRIFLAVTGYGPSFFGGNQLPNCTHPCGSRLFLTLLEFRGTCNGLECRKRDNDIF